VQQSDGLPGLTDLVERVQARIVGRPGARTMIGIVGAPGAGKSTLALALQAALAEAGASVAYLPMDGFHLSNAALSDLGRADRKGAPDTFDAAGYVALLRRIRAGRAGSAGSADSADPAGSDETVWAPAFDRGLEEPVAGSIAVPASTSVVITEGNYLLLEQGPWSDVAGLLDEVWFCAVADSVRRARLVERHHRFGKSLAAAQAWAAGPDERNAELIEATRPRADVIVSGA
jgi:pantothenate kinase